jgi:general secretion pathway protein G
MRKRTRTTKSAPLGGFTLLELMVVLIILALLASIVAPRVTHYLSRAKLETAKLQVSALGHAVDEFHLDTGQFPTSAEGLKALTTAPPNTPSWGGPYVKKQDSLIDPWGHAYLYRYPGQHGRFDVYTLGPDPKAGSAANAQEIGNW